MVSLRKGLVGHWTMDDSDTSNGVLYDRSAYDNHGAINGSPTTGATGEVSEAYSFSGTEGDFVECDVSSISWNEQHTLTAWVKIDSDGAFSTSNFGGSILASGDFDTALFSSSLPEVRFFVLPDDTSSATNIGTGITADTWHHVAGVRDSSNVAHLYVNGTEVATDAIGGTDAINSNTLYSGDNAGTGGDAFKGDIDDTRAYNRALSDSEISALYNMRSQRQHNSNTIFVESFENGSFDSKWNVSNATISSTRSFSGNFSFGSFNEGGVEADLVIQPNGYEKIESFEYYWKEFSGQTGHVVILYDQNGNQVQESGTENPQWYLNDGSDGRVQISNSGTNYNVWTRFKFDFDWENGEYDYVLEKTDGTHSDTGTQPLDNSTGVSKIRFTGSGYGSADFNRFDDISINE